MKKIVVFLLLTAFASVLYAQESNCQHSLTGQQFRQKLNQIKSRSTDQNRLQIAKQIVTNFCVSSAQVEEIASVFEDDYIRYEFAKKAFKNTTDKENFYDVYDVFIYYSVVFKLHDYVLSQKGESNTNNTEIHEKMEFPDYQYPSLRTYRRNRNCAVAISNSNFLTSIKKIYYLDNDQQKYIKAVAFIKNKCISTTHLMKTASLIKNENYRLGFAKEGLKSVYDIDNYIEMKQVFNSPRARNEFIKFMEEQNTNSLNICKVSEQDYNKILNTIKNENFNSSKVNSAKHLIQANKCFTAIQIKGIVKLFEYENSKLEIAMYAYNFTSNKKNYYVTLSKALGFDSSKKKLLNYINKQGK